MIRPFFIFSIVISALILSCSNEKDKKQINENQLVDLLIDIHQADALVTNHELDDMTGKMDSLSLYSSVFNKHQVTREDFDATMKWYSQHPEKLTELYDKVFEEISKNNDQNKAELDRFHPQNLIRLWHKRNIRVRGDTSSYPKPFIIPIDTPGLYFIELKVRMQKDDKAENPVISGYFYKSDPDEESERIHLPTRSLIKSNYMKEYLFQEEVTDTAIKYLQLTIPEINNDTNVFFKNTQISLVQVSRVKNKEEKEN